MRLWRYRELLFKTVSDPGVPLRGLTSGFGVLADPGVLCMGSPAGFAPGNGVLPEGRAALGPIQLTPCLRQSGVSRQLASHTPWRLSLWKWQGGVWPQPWMWPESDVKMHRFRVQPARRGPARFRGDSAADALLLFVKCPLTSAEKGVYASYTRACATAQPAPGAKQ